jgi:Cornifin (SPRR) family
MKRTEPGWFVLTLAGFAALLGSFLPFYTYAPGVDVTVWSRGLFPTAALIPVLGLLIGLEALFVLIVGHEPRSPFLNFTWEQVRLAVGTFMILLAFSYLLQDRAGGSLGSGYLVLSLSALVTFGGALMTRRAQLARARAEAAPARVRHLRLKPAIAAVKRTSATFARNVAALSVAFASSVAALSRRAAKGTVALGRNVKPHLGMGEPNEANQATTLDAKLDAAPPAPPSPPPPTFVVDEPFDTTATGEPVGSPVAEEPVEEVADEPAASTAAEAADVIAEEPVEAPAVDEPAAPNLEEPAEASVEEAVEVTAEEPTDEIAAEPTEVTVAEPTEVTVAEPTDEIAAEPTEVIVAEPTDEIAAEPTEEIVVEPARVAAFSAVTPEKAPEDAAPPDGETSPKSESTDGSDQPAARKPRRARTAAKKARAGSGTEPPPPNPPS